MAPSSASHEEALPRRHGNSSGGGIHALADTLLRRGAAAPRVERDAAPHGGGMKAVSSYAHLSPHDARGSGQSGPPSSHGPDSVSGASSSFHKGVTHMDFTFLGGPFSLPFFAAGYAVATDSLNPILLQSYFDAEVVRFAEELLTPSPERSSRLLVEPVPRRFHGKTYSFLAASLLKSYSVVVMGLYRTVSRNGQHDHRTKTITYGGA